METIKRSVVARSVEGGREMNNRAQEIFRVGSCSVIYCNGGYMT